MKFNSIKAVALAAVTLASVSGIAANPRFGIVVSNDYASNPQEKTAADYVVNSLGGELITPSSLSRLTVENFDAVMVHIDRCGIGAGVANLPADYQNAVNSLAEFAKNGGGVYLSKHATQLAVSMGRISNDFQVNIFGSGDGGAGFDDWNVNAHLGSWMFNPNNPDQDPSQVYDRRTHEIYAGLTEQTPDGKDYYHNSFPMEGTGNDATSMHREDHNCCWDLNAISAYTVEGKNTIEKWEGTTNSVVLGTWGHVQDYCVVGINEFIPTAEFKGTIMANGLAACEWAPRQGGNVYHANLEKLTSNVMNYIAAEGPESGVAAINVEAGETAFYTMTGVRVANPANGLYIKVVNGKASKIVVK